MSQRGGVDARSKLGRAMFSLVDASRKLSVDTRTRVVRVRNAIEANPDDALTRFSVRSDLDVLGRDPKLNSIVRMLWKAMAS